MTADARQSVIHGFAIYHYLTKVLYIYLSQPRKLHTETMITVLCAQEQPKLSPLNPHLQATRLPSDKTALQGLLDHEGAHTTCMSWKAGRENKWGLGEQKLS